MSEQVGWRGLLAALRTEAPQWGTMLPQVPRLVHDRLKDGRQSGLQQAFSRIADAQRLQNRLTAAAVAVLALILLLELHRVFG
jgi:ubiquinone biosynthesis protein